MEALSSSSAPVFGYRLDGACRVAICHMQMHGSFETATMFHMCVFNCVKATFCSRVTLLAAQGIACAVSNALQGWVTMWGIDGRKKGNAEVHSNTSTHLGLQPTSYLFQKSFQRASFFAFMAEPLRPRCACTLSVSCTRHSTSAPCPGRGVSHQRLTLTRTTSQKQRKLGSRLGEQGEGRSLPMEVHRDWVHETPLLRLGLPMVLRQRRLCNSRGLPHRQRRAGEEPYISEAGNGGGHGLSGHGAEDARRLVLLHHAT